MVFRYMVSVIGVLWAAQLALAQVIEVRVKDPSHPECPNSECLIGSYQPSVEIRIDLAGILQNYPTFEFVRVSATSLTTDIGQITFHNDTNGAVPDEVRLLVAARQGLSIDFPVAFGDAIEPACEDWGGSDSAPGPALVIEPWDGAETTVILAARVAGDVRGDITCGQVFTLQVPLGSISGTVQATWPDSITAEDGINPNLDTQEYAIQYIAVRDGIFGNVIAGQAAEPTPNVIPPKCSIRTILIGGDDRPQSAGMQGNIHAYGGIIRNVESSGPIGSATTPASIQARFGLTALTCRALESGLPAPRHVYANIRTNWVNEAPPVVQVPHGPPETRDVLWASEGWIRRVMVSGDIHGTIRANVLRPFPTFGDYGYEQGDPFGTTYGVFADGSCHANILFDHGVLITSLMATEFTAPITCGSFLKGRLIATTGGIAAITAGRAPIVSDSRGIPFPNGFVSALQRPFWDNITFGDDPLGCPGNVVENEAESIVHAATTIGLVDLAAMDYADTQKMVPPMVEAPVIDTLRIDYLRLGVVWSGVRSTCVPESGVRCGPDPADPASYPYIRDAQFINIRGKPVCLLPAPYDTSVYVAGFERFDVLARHGGLIYLDGLDTDEHMRVGCSTGDPTIGSSQGDIIFREAGTFAGQLSINSNAAASATGACAPFENWSSAIGWHGPVVSPGAGGVVTLDDTGTQPDQAPHYRRLSADLGGGAVGEFPASLHEHDCLPAHPVLADPADTTPLPTFLSSEFAHAHNDAVECGPAGSFADRSIVLAFRDYVRAESALPPFRCTPVAQPTVDYTSYLQWEFVPEYAGGPSRHLRVWANVQHVDNFASDEYVIRPALDVWGERLLCDQLLSADSWPVADFEYRFTIDVDCNRNGVADTTDIANGWADVQPGGPDGLLDCCQGFPTCDPDYNQDGNVDQDDVAYLVDVIAGGPNPTGRDPDFNRDGNVDQDDQAALIDRVAGGPCP